VVGDAGTQNKILALLESLQAQIRDSQKFSSSDVGDLMREANGQARIATTHSLHTCIATHSGGEENVGEKESVSGKKRDGVCGKRDGVGGIEHIDEQRDVGGKEGVGGTYVGGKEGDNVDRKRDVGGKEDVGGRGYLVGRRANLLMGRGMLVGRKMLVAGDMLVGRRAKRGILVGRRLLTRKSMLVGRKMSVERTMLVRGRASVGKRMVCVGRGMVWVE